MTRHIVLNDLVYNERQLDPLESLQTCLAFAVDDWGASRAMAWVYGIVLGWDDDDEAEPIGAMDENAAKFGWGPETIERLRQLRAAFVALCESQKGAA